MSKVDQIKEKKPQRAPYFEELTFGLVFLVISIAVYYFMQGREGTLADIIRFSNLTLLGCSLYFLWGMGARIHGVQFEKKWIKKLRLPEDWKIQTNIKTPFGDCDAKITSPDNESWVVEIKSYEGLKLGLFGGVRKLNGKSVKKDPVKQVTQNQQFLKADHALVWCPKSKLNNHFDTQGATVINGNEGKLKKMIGAKTGFFS